MADGGDQVLLKDRFEIKPAVRLAQFDQGSAHAFGAEDLSHPGRKLFALICSGALPCRGLHLPERKTLPPLLWPEMTGMVDWPVANQGGAQVWGRRPALIYPQPAGERMAKSDTDTLPMLNEQTVVRTVLKPAIDVLRELGHLGIAHRAIRPTNIFYAAGQSGDVVFGECFGSVPGAEQPVVFETIENGIANPLGRAPGQQADDLYALGVLVLLLHMGRNPTQSMTPEQIVAAKINFGTFSALVGGEKVSPTMAEMLRGLLADKVSDRWTLRNLDMWMLGQHFNPVLPTLPKRATRPIRFAGIDQMNKPALAVALAMHWSEAVEFAQNPTLESWLRRGFNDEKVDEPLAQLRGLAFSFGAPGGVKHRTVSRLIQFMGNALPICYRDTRVHITGLGGMLAAVIDNAPLRTEFVELLRGRLPQGWIDQQPKLSPELAQVRRMLDMLEPLIERPGPGYSVERALYELEPNAPCRSALIADYCVTSLKDLLPAIDAALPGAEAGTLPMDRHIAAFIAARIGRSVDRELNRLGNMADQFGYRLGVLRLLAEVRRQYPGDELPRLAEALVEMLTPIAEGFHRLKSRGEIREKLRRLAAQSDFVEMAELLDEDGPARQLDARSFEQAQRNYAALEREAKWLEEGGLTSPERIHASARVNSAITSAFLASAAVAMFAVLMVV